MAGRPFAFHSARLVIPGLPYNPLSPPGLVLECRVSFDHHQPKPKETRGFALCETAVQDALFFHFPSGSRGELVSPAIKDGTLLPTNANVLQTKGLSGCITNISPLDGDVALIRDGNCGDCPISRLISGCK